MTGASDQRDYSIFGLRVRSRLALPELFPASAPGEPDVTIETGEVPQVDSKDGGLTAMNGSLVLAVPGVARYRITGGAHVVVEPVPGVPDENIRLYLLGSVFGALLHQRGLLPLHANAIEIQGNAFAFMAPSGHGKSTLAGWFHRHGLRLIADDVCVVKFEPHGAPAVLPGLPRLRLWSEAFGTLGWSHDGLSRSYAGHGNFDKFDLPVRAGSAVHSPVPLAAVYLLDRGDAFEVEPLVGLEAAEAVFANTYRGSYVSTANQPEAHWNAAVRIVKSTRMFRLRRKWDLAELDGECRKILDHASDVAVAATGELS
jgi:hypothetical protein